MQIRTLITFAALLALAGCKTTRSSAGDATKPGPSAVSAAKAGDGDENWDPDAFAPAAEIGPGSKPAIVVDIERTKIHLVYRHRDKVLYRIGDLSGRFGSPEEVLEAEGPETPDVHSEPDMPPSLWHPRIALDRNGVPHVVVASGHFLNRFLWYSNRIGGTWKPKTVVVDKVADAVSRATMPSLAVDDNGSVFVSAYAPTGINKTHSYGIMGLLIRLENVDATPKIGLKKRTHLEDPQLILVKGELWLGGRYKGYSLYKLDKRSLEPEEPATLLTDGKFQGEIARLSTDASGDIHVASSYYRLDGRPEGGWYNTLFRARAGKRPIPYRTTNRHAWGAGMPVRDLRAQDRIYVLYWSGAPGDQYGEIHYAAFRTAEATNQLRFARIEADRTVVEGKELTDRPRKHGYSRRATPAAAPHPQGGVLVVFEEHGAESTSEADDLGTLFFTRLGAPSPRGGK
jgi:hypothetical protein